VQMASPAKPQARRIERTASILMRSMNGLSWQVDLKPLQYDMALANGGSNLWEREGSSVRYLT